MPKKSTEPRQVTVENVNVPGYSVKLDAVKYEAMRKAILAILPPEPPGLTQAEIRRGVLSHLPDELFPGGSKAGWWAKMVQLDLEAKSILDRQPTTPLRWHIKKTNRSN